MNDKIIQKNIDSDKHKQMQVLRLASSYSAVNVSQGATQIVDW